MEGIPRDCSTLERLPYSESPDEESSLQDDDSKEYPECPEFGESGIWILDTGDRSLGDLDDGKYKQYGDRESRHRFCLAMSVWMVAISGLLSVSDTEEDDP